VAAATAAAGVQQSLAGAVWQQPEGLQVRAAVHTGVVYPRDGDLFGTAVNKVARLLSVCPPGAVLVSNAMAAVLADRAPEGLDLVQVGRVQLAGFASSDEVWAVRGAGLAEVHKVDTVSTSTRRGVLPTIDNDLLGRADDLEAVWESLGRSSIVTLVGVGGMGKTRLALEVATGAAESYPGGVWWIDLTAATAADAVVPVVNSTVGALETPERSALQVFCDHFVDQRALVVFDNCEHVLQAAREVVGALVAAAPGVRVLCTSREALSLGREQVYPVGSLGHRAATELFVERALAVRPDLDVAAHATTVAGICDRLDGIPLAIELAAARCRSMSPAEISAHLDDRFRLLRGGRTGSERHRTLQAAVAWSYSLLDDDEQRVFTAMAVFAGGTLLDALASVTGLDSLEALDVVDRLIARSMVTATDTPLGTRYSQLETLRQFAEDRLIEAESIDAMRDRHLQWVRDLSAWFEPSKLTPRGGQAFRRFCGEIDNLRVAVAHAVASQRREIAYEIAASSVEYVHWRPIWEVMDWVRPVNPEGEWTQASAVCATSCALIDQHGGRLRTDRVTIGGAPEHFVRSHGVVGGFQIGAMLNAGARPREVAGLIEQMTPSSPQDRFWLEVHVLYVELFRLRYGELSDVEKLRAAERARAFVASVEATGDELFLARARVGAAGLLVAVSADESAETARAALESADRLGALLISSMARLYLRNARRRSSDPMSRAAVVREVRLELASLLDGDRLMLACSELVVSLDVYATADPAVAARFVAAFEHHVGRSAWRELELAGVAVDRYRAEATARAGSISLRDALMDVLDVLDQLIAAELEGAG
jgi:predicted ATPase